MVRTLYTLEVRITHGPMTGEFLARNPVISRTIRILADQTLDHLHRAMCEAFGRRGDSHLSEFNLAEQPWDRHAARFVLPPEPDRLDELDGGPAAGSVTTTSIGGLGLEVGSLFWYWYDFGDNWYHEIRVMAIGEAEPGAKYPRVVASVGESPPESRSWEESDLGEREVHEDWVADLLNDGETVPGIESGITPMGPGRPVLWVRRKVTAAKVSLARDLPSRRTYHVTTLGELDDGTGELTSYVVPGAVLGPWLVALARTGEATVLSVAAA